MSLRIVFAGTPDFSVPPLRALLASPHPVVAAYTQPDRPAGRGRQLAASPVKELAGVKDPLKYDTAVRLGWQRAEPKPSP